LSTVDSGNWVAFDGVNPTVTIQALALHIADRMKQRLGKLFDWGAGTLTNLNKTEHL